MERDGYAVNKRTYEVQEWYSLADGEFIVLTWIVTCWGEYEDVSVTGEVVVAPEYDPHPDNTFSKSISPSMFPMRVLEKMALNSEADKDAIIKTMEERNGDD